MAEAIYAAVKPLKLNYECLGNAEPHVHWHVFPRYESDELRRSPVWARPESERKLALEEDDWRALMTSLRAEILKAHSRRARLRRLSGGCGREGLSAIGRLVRRARDAHARGMRRRRCPSRTATPARCTRGDAADAISRTIRASMTAAMWQMQVPMMEQKMRQAGLPELSGDERTTILDYLARNAGARLTRRAPFFGASF